MEAGFDCGLCTRIVFGPGALQRLGELARELGAARAFLVTDAGLVAAGHPERAEASLRAAGIAVRRFDAARENPSSSDVAACRAALGDWPAEVLIGLGGGSSIDTAKGCAFVHAGGGRMEDYWGTGKARGTLLPLIAVPTTAGTGSEVQSFALIGQDGTHRKMACGDAQAAPRIALLDPTLTVTQPRAVTAVTGLDALSHAVETAVTRKRNALSRAWSAAAFRRIAADLPRVLADPNDLEARGSMLAAAALAGLAIECSMLGAAHALANPLTARHGIAHGQAVATVLPAVVRFNAELPEVATLYAELARDARLCPPAAEDRGAAAALAEHVRRMLDLAGLPRSLRALGVAEDSVDRLAEESAQQWTAQWNPRPVTAGDFRVLLLAALGP